VFCIIHAIQDEPSNHLDVGCIQGLANALSGWGGKDGAVVVVSHDREFCEKVGFTHIGTVTDGKLVLEQVRKNVKVIVKLHHYKKNHVYSSQCDLNSFLSEIFARQRLGTV